MGLPGKAWRAQRRPLEVVVDVASQHDGIGAVVLAAAVQPRRAEGLVVQVQIREEQKLHDLLSPSKTD